MEAPDAAPPSRRELTVRAVVLGLSLSVVMGAANVYVGLKAGMTVSASIPAAVTAMLVFRFLFRERSILEANQVQTGASAGESLAAGIIFTMPALVLVGVWQSFDFWTVTLVAFSGGLLGVLLMIPMRRVFVTGSEELPYPEGVACAAVLKAGAETGAAADARPLIAGTLVGAVFKALVSFVGLIRGSVEGAISWGRLWYVGADVSPMLVAVGAIVGLNVALLIALGGAIGWLIIIPALGGAATGDPLEAAWELWSTRVRYVGVGAMVVGGAHSIFKVRRGLVHAIQELSGKARRAATPSDTDRDLPVVAILSLTALAVVIIGALYRRFTGDLGIATLALACALVMSFFFTAVASYIVGLVGNSNSPVSGMTITAVLFTGILLSVFGYSGTEGMIATLGVAAVVCCVACTAGDVCNDLKTGSLVGASPARQQIMQVLGVLIASFVMAPVLGLLHTTAEGGIGGRELPAPQAGLFASLAKAFAGRGELPMDMVLLGIGIGIGILLLDVILERRQTRFRAHLMPIAVGIYLPFGIAPPILLGGLLSSALGRRSTRTGGAFRVVLFSSGAIAGESLTGIGLAGLAAAGVGKLGLGLPEWVTLTATVGAIAAFIRIFWKESSEAVTHDDGAAR